MAMESSAPTRAEAVVGAVVVAQHKHPSLSDGVGQHASHKVELCPDAQPAEAWLLDISHQEPDPWGAAVPGVLVQPEIALHPASEDEVVLVCP